MSKRVTPEEVVVNFFNTGELSKVETVFNIVKSVVKGRLGSKPAVRTAKAVKTTAAKGTSVPVATE
jgi:hypothetical protein